MDVTLSKIDEVYVQVHCDEGIKAELSDFFSFFAPNYQFSPLFKKRVWNGKIYLFNKKNSYLYCGLVHYLHGFCKDRKLSFEYKEAPRSFSDFTVEKTKEFAKILKLHSRGNPIEPHDHQITAFLKSVLHKKVLLLSPTASGKSLIIYMLTRFLLGTECKRGLLIVPTISLVEQMYGDFQDYSSANGWNVDANVQKIYQGQDKVISKSLTISTWQSIHEFPKKFFEQFDFVVGDEAHGFKAKSMTNIMTKLSKAKYRIGTTGTIDDTVVNKLTLEGHFGPAVRVITTKELIDKKQLSDFEIKCLILKYPEQLAKLVKEMDFQQEMDFLVSNDIRNNFITNLSMDIKGNTLILFQFVEKHGKILYNKVLERTKDQPNRKVFFVCGQTEAADREAVRHITEKENDAIIVASYGVFSTGVNIRRLHNIIFASPSKSKIRNLQSIGRGLRLGEDKEKAVLYDISDDLRVGEYINYTMNHYAERVKIYHAEKFKITTYKVELKYD
ncbi:SSL2 DNA or RNA helicases of superfamily II [uncultured Caudovirales phage]|uniref:SSL2 DNA or RNA helicases of superfamily II n=1 Tax=uncultured Caudovirales phage TaxID=2100421 RepID=A0A6J5KPQ9_9CAUD|nr:SSL2 DNA or RNA helicases of superfamily II [uncultured Caudovirales phage]